MKIIDAINKINKEEKFRFRLLCNGFIYKYIGGSLYNETVGERAEWIIDNKWLNQEIEILENLEEEKKIPEKLFFTHISNYNDQSVVNNNFNNYFKKTQETINQLIDYLKSM